MLERHVRTQTYTHFNRIRHATRPSARTRLSTSRNIVGSIPDGVIWTFHWHNPPCRTMTLGSTQPLTEISNRNISWGVKGGRCLELTVLPPLCADRFEIWERETPGTLWICNTPYRDCFTFSSGRSTGYRAQGAFLMNTYTNASDWIDWLFVPSRDLIGGEGTKPRWITISKTTHKLTVHRRNVANEDLFVFKYIFSGYQN